MNDLSNFISSVGFPIVVAVAMYYQNTTLSSNYQKLTEQMEKKLDVNSQAISDLINTLKEKGDLND